MFSVVIVSYNTRDLLRDCLASLERHEPGAEVIVVDNGSRDGSPEMVRESFAGVTLIALSENRGFAGANNVGIEQASGPYLVLLNSDTVLEDDALSRCVAELESEPTLGAISPRLIGLDGRPQVNRHPLPSLGAIARAVLDRPPRPESAGEVWLPGTALVLRRQALEAVGGRLDDAYFMYWEDADLSARLLRDGWEARPYEGAHVRHFGGASGGGADASRRADLHAWFLHGQFRWFARHRPALEMVGLWLLLALDLPRCWARSLVRPGRRHDRIHARVLASTLVRFPLGLSPPRPAASTRPAVAPVLAEERLGS